MTTVAYRDGIMAADTACWEGHTRVHDVTKVWLIFGHLVGAAGVLRDVHKFREWAEDGFALDKHPKMKDITALVVTPEGKILAYEDNDTTATEITDEYVSIGAGSAVALGAMHSGASAEQAVQAAIYHNAHTDGTVNTITLSKDNK